MNEKTGSNTFMIINIILTVVMAAMLVLFFIFRLPWMIIVLALLFCYFILLFIWIILRSRIQWKPRIQSSLTRYYLLMAGILLAELAVSYILFLTAEKLPLLFALVVLLLFIALIGWIIYSSYREKIKITDKTQVITGYKKIFLRILVGLGGAVAVIIIIKAFILLYNSAFY